MFATPEEVGVALPRSADLGLDPSPGTGTTDTLAARREPAAEGKKRRKVASDPLLTVDVDLGLPLSPPCDSAVEDAEVDGRGASAPSGAGAGAVSTSGAFVVPVIPSTAKTTRMVRDCRLSPRHSCPLFNSPHHPAHRSQGGFSDVPLINCARPFIFIRSRRRRLLPISACGCWSSASRATASSSVMRSGI